MPDAAASGPRLLRVAFDYKHWLRTARELLVVAELLNRQVLGVVPLPPKGKEYPEGLLSGLLRSFQLVSGYAVENALKAVLVSQGKILSETILRRSAAGPVPGSPEVRLTFEGVGRGELHDLPALARVSGLNLSQGEKRLLSTLSVAVRWAARYPLPWTEIEHDKYWSDSELRVVRATDAANLRTLIERCVGAAEKNVETRRRGEQA